MKYKLVKAFSIYVDGKPVKVRRIVEVTPTHIIVEHMDGRIEAIPLERAAKATPLPRAVMV